MPLPFDIGSIGQSATQIAVSILQKTWPTLDTRGRDLATAIDDGLARAAAKAWTETASKKAGLPSGLDDGASDLRALVLQMGITRSVLLDPARKPSAQDQAAADVLAKTWIIIAQKAGYKGETVDAIKKSSTTAELAVIEVIVVIVAAALVAAIIAFVIYKAAEVIETAIADYVENQELMRLHAEAQKVIDNHIAAEKAAGHPLPYTPDEQKILADLQKAQQHIVDTVAPPKPWKPPDVSPGLNIGVVIVALGLVGAGYLYLRPHRG